MRRVIYFFTAFVMLLIFTGCGTDSASGSEGVGENTAPAAQTADAMTNIDVDLTLLSGTMVYAEVSNMMCSPESYMGKTVKMHGQFVIYQETDANGQPIPDRIFFACVIADATACCSQGLEFVLAGEHSYPEDYPQPGTEITVIGVFDTYEEDGYMYCQLIYAKLAD